MFKRITALLLIIAVLSANSSRLFIYAGFSLNQKYIASTLCENRDKPWLHCNGKCYFIKKIKQAEEKEKSEDARNQKNLFQEAFFTNADRMLFHTKLLQTVLTPYHLQERPAAADAVFQPPKA